MSAPPESLDRLEHYLGRLLSIGILLSAIALAAGIIMYLFDPGPIANRLLAVGLIALMATPMLRVAVSVVEYIRMREWFFVATTVIVLAELTLSVVYALRR